MKYPHRFRGWIWDEMSLVPPEPDDLARWKTGMGYWEARAINAGNFDAWFIILKHFIIEVLLAEGVEASHEALEGGLRQAQNSDDPPKAVRSFLLSMARGLPTPRSERFNRACTLCENLMHLRRHMRRLVGGGQEELRAVEALCYAAIWLNECGRQLWAAETGALERLDWGQKLDEGRRKQRTHAQALKAAVQALCLLERSGDPDMSDRAFAKRHGTTKTKKDGTLFETELGPMTCSESSIRRYLAQL